MTPKPTARRARLVWIACFIAAIGIAVPYAIEPAYNFAPPRAFRGSVLLNPYAGDSAAGLRWYKVNLHAHTRAWGGLTKGLGTPEQLVASYRSLGYDLAAVTNYHRIDGPPGALSGYEDGYNINKSHILVLGTSSVDWHDFILFESRRTKQNRIARVSRPGVVTIIAHPSLRDGFTTADLQQLSGYTAIEVLSQYGNSEAQWDAALTAGRPVWGVGDDDTHNATNIKGMGRAWTMVRSATASPDDVLDAVRAGRTVAVSGRGGRSTVWLDALTVRGDTIDLRLGGHPARITFVGAEGRVLASVPAADRARYILGANEPYARTVVEADSNRLDLNPVVRTEDGHVPMPEARIDGAGTTVRRSALFAIVIALILDWLGVLRAIARSGGRSRVRVPARPVDSAAME